MLPLLACVATEPADSGAPADSPTGNPDSAAPDSADSAAPDSPAETLPGETGSTEPDPGAALFREDVVHELAIELDEAAWAALSADGDAWVPGVFVFEGASAEVGVRLKGNGSYRELEDKPSFKIDFNRYVDGGRVDGLKGVDLHNEIYDAAAISEFVVYHLYRNAGQPQSRTGFAHLTVAGLDYGFYMVVEQKDDVFVERWWPGDSDGSLYESSSENWPCDFEDEGEPRCDCFVADEYGSGDSRSDLEAACAAATDSADEDWWTTVQASFDAEEVLREIALEILVANWDTYAAARGNFYTYHPPDSGAWALIASSMNQSFGTPAGEAACGEYHYSPEVFDNAVLARRCWADEACAEALYAELWTQVDVLAASDVVAATRAAAELVDPWVTADSRRPYSAEDFRGTIDCIADWLEGRPDSLGAELPER